jgi:hypothetical protein
MRRFNYTGRRALKQSAVNVAVAAKKSGELEVRAKVNLAEYAPWPPDARAVLEVYDGPVFERLDLGQVDNTNQLSFTKSLALFRGESNPQFRFKVISAESERGKLLALCKVRARRDDDEDATSAMLHVTVRPLDSQPFVLEITENAHPVLVINERLPPHSQYSGKAFAKDPIFVSMVIPQIFRAILTDIILVQAFDGEEEEDRPESKWFAFAQRLNADPLPPVEDQGQRRLWIDAAVDEFARKNEIMSKFKAWSVK